MTLFDDDEPVVAEAEETTVELTNEDAGATMEDGPSGSPNDIQEGMDNENPEAEPAPDNEEFESVPLPSKKISKTLEALDAIYNPERYENERSLWQFWEQELKEFPTVDEMASDYEKKGLRVDMEKMHYEWFDILISHYRRFLQRAFEDSLELPVLGRRLQRFQETNQFACHWRYAWIKRYKEQETAELERKQASATNMPTVEDRRAAALARRQARQRSSNADIVDSDPVYSVPINMDENVDFEEDSPTAEKNTQQPETEKNWEQNETERRRRAALLRRQKKSQTGIP